MQTVLAISLGAIAGALSRYYVGLGMTHAFGSELPYGTFIVNVTGCFVMGFLTVLSQGEVIRIHPDVRLLLLTGFLGSYTTFASYELDTAKLLQQRSLVPGLFYWTSSPLVGWLSLRFGMVLAEWLSNQLERRRSI